MNKESNSGSCSLQEANELLRNKKWKQALEAYHGLWGRVPLLQKSLAWNISYILKKAPSNILSPEIKAASERILDSVGVQLAMSPRDDGDRGIAVEDLYAEVALKMNERFLVFNGPLVTVIVTTHNVEDYIEECLRSLREQTYKNVEIIVVDDASNDRTAEIVDRISRSQVKLKLLRLNANLGTYFAKNYGLTIAKGDYIFFQDGDDFSHPDRLALCMGRLLHSGKDVVRGAYARFRPETNRIVKVNGLVSKLGLITLGVRRSVFKEIGFFNNTTKASDEEFFERVKKFLGSEAIVNEPLPLYFATYREKSLFSDMVVASSDGDLTQQPSIVRANYVREFKRVHEETPPKFIFERFQFPSLRDQIPVAAELSKLVNPKLRVIANVCSIPTREKAFQSTVASIIGQCDHLNIYLDRYQKVPDFLSSYSAKTTIYRHQERPGLRDNGKFIALEQLVENGEDAYYLTIDDDIVYPPDYVSHLINTIERHDGKVAVGVHGVILKEFPRGYFSDSRYVYAFERKLEKNRLVNVLGTGTLCFRVKAIKNFSLEFMEKAGMADLYFAILAKRNALPMICVSRHEKWLVDMDASGAESLFHEYVTKDDMQGELIRQSGPWGRTAIEQVVNIADQGLVDLLRESLPKIEIYHGSSI